jgi:hypothetical protein
MLSHSLQIIEGACVEAMEPDEDGEEPDKAYFRAFVDPLSVFVMAKLIREMLAFLETGQGERTQEELIAHVRSSCMLEWEGDGAARILGQHAKVGP